MGVSEQSRPLNPAILLDWYAAAARDLPWRRPDATPWAVLVSEVMLQQTPAARVIPAYEAWLEKWPSPRDCARASVAEVVRAWGRLGYPRRALRLREAALACAGQHGGEIPRDSHLLGELPGVGAYTAAAVAAFAFGERIAVVDTNVKRVLTRAIRGTDDPRPVAARDRVEVGDALPTRDAARWSAAVMELGATVCRARAPRCAACPIAATCTWFGAGAPAWVGPVARPQGYAGTDRQVRGRLLALLRDAPTAVPPETLAECWPDAPQRDRALASLVTDGLAVPVTGGYALPS